MFQAWDLSAKKRSKAPEGAASADEGGWGTLVKYAMSDDPLILRLISSSTTSLVISFSSKETPDLTGAAMMPEKHLVSHSAAHKLENSSLFCHAVLSQGAGEMSSA